MEHLAGSVVVLMSILQLMMVAAAAMDDDLSRSNFPPGFVFGSATSAFQTEGGWNEDGKGPSIWDTFTFDYPDKIADKSNATVADDMYHRYKGDVKRMKDLGLDAIRISISWARLFPDGKVAKGVNQLGLQFYNNLFNELLANGIKPYVTLFHWDLPQSLEDEYGGFLSPNIVEDLRDFADVCFREFGDRVKDWMTVNEPTMFTGLGYATGDGAPGRCSPYIGNCTAGNSATEPYLVIHHILLSHASIVKLYRDNYQEYQGGKIGIVVLCEWFVPINQSSTNLEAASRSFDFASGWILDPINNGDYPETMRSIVGNRLPKFSKEEATMLKHSFDFIGLNYYTSFYAEDNSTVVPQDELSYTTDSHTTITYEKDGIPISEPTGCMSMHIYPEGLQSMLSYIKEKYNNPPVIIAENGICTNASISYENPIQDYLKIKYLQLHLSCVHKQIKNGTNVKGYFFWSLLDDFEWISGFEPRYGFYYVDYEDGLKRYPKYSAYWVMKFLQKDVGIKKLRFASMK